MVEFNIRYPPAPMPPRHDLRQNPNPQDPNFDPTRYVDDLLGNNVMPRNQNQNPNRTLPF